MLLIDLLKDNNDFISVLNNYYQDINDLAVHHPRGKWRILESLSERKQDIEFVARLCYTACMLYHSSIETGVNRVRCHELKLKEKSYGLMSLIDELKNFLDNDGS